MKEIADIRVSYEYILVKFKGDEAWYYLNPDTLKGHKLEGDVLKKNTRTWFESKQYLARKREAGRASAVLWVKKK